MDDTTKKNSSQLLSQAKLLVSIIILNYNGRIWLKRCLESLYEQTIFENFEIIVADNASTDGSDQLAAALIAPWLERAKFVQNGTNLGFCEGNNCGATFAKGDYLFFLNNDTWLEKDCMEQLLAGMSKLKADCGTPLICNYDDNSFQSLGALGFDLFGYMSTVPSKVSAGSIFAAPGCSLLVKTEVFWRLGGFDSELFMYGDEVDLAWRLALAGYKTVSIPQARLHHRSSAGFNSGGKGQLAEYRTNEMVRFLSNRNSLVVLLKNSQHILLIIAALQALMLLLEAAVLLVLVRKWDMVKYAYLGALADCWRLRHHVYKERHRIRNLRRHGDFWMLRFLRARFSRHSYELKRLIMYGPPKVDPKKL